jgi:hypothetical protein
MMPAAAQLLPRLALSLVLSLLCGCRFAGDLVAAGAGGASAAATANPAVGVAVGIGVDAGIDATFAYVGRKWQQAEQDAIAADVAAMQPGERRPWKVEHIIPVGNEHGEVAVVRAIATPLTLCKELAFSVDSGSGTAMTRHWYVTQACRDGAHWKWSLAEPTTERWGTLQ